MPKQENVTQIRKRVKKRESTGSTARVGPNSLADVSSQLEEAASDLDSISVKKSVGNLAYGRKANRRNATGEHVVLQSNRNNSSNESAAGSKESEEDELASLSDSGSVDVPVPAPHSDDSQDILEEDKVEEESYPVKRTLGEAWTDHKTASTVVIVACLGAAGVAGYFFWSLTQDPSGSVGASIDFMQNQINGIYIAISVLALLLICHMAMQHTKSSSHHVDNFFGNAFSEMFRFGKRPIGHKRTDPSKGKDTNNPIYFAD